MIQIVIAMINKKLVKCKLNDKYQQYLRLQLYLYTTHHNTHKWHSIHMGNRGINSSHIASCSGFYMLFIFHLFLAKRADAVMHLQHRLSTSMTHDRANFQYLPLRVMERKQEIGRISKRVTINATYNECILHCCTRTPKCCVKVYDGRKVLWPL